MNRWSNSIFRLRWHWGLWGAGIVGLAYFGQAAVRLERAAVSQPGVASQIPAWPVAVAPAAPVWDAFRRPGGPTAGLSSPLAQRFRLAGTFFTFAEQAQPGQRPECRAVVDDLQKKDQYLVREGDAFEGFDVLRIYRDRIVVKTAGGEEELRLSFAGAGQPAGTVTGPVASGSGDTEVALESNRFGKRVGDNRWVMSRESLLDYYEELKDDPERMAAIFESLKPDYKDGAIGGYYLDVEGEADFFKAAGLEQGDVIRKVNSVNMTSQARAEYFIRLFVQNNLSAVVLDVEHQGQPRKMVYLIR